MGSREANGGCVERQTGEWMGRWVDFVEVEVVDGWMDKEVGGWVNGEMDGWVDGWAYALV